MQKEDNHGELWDRVILPNGMIGYVFQSYLREVPNRQIEAINVSSDKTLLKKGETIKLKVEILPDEAKDHEIEYISSNPKVATVDSIGNVMAIKSGTTTITVKAKENNVKGEIQIKVITPVTGIELTNQNIVMQVGDQFTIKPIITPVDADNKNVIYSSKDEQIAKIDIKGNITAIKEGNTKITVMAEDGALKKEIDIIVVKKLNQGEVKFDESLNIMQNEITGWDIENFNV